MKNVYLSSTQLREYHGTKIYIEASVARNSLQESILRSGSNIKNTISMSFVRFDVRIYLIRVYRSYPYFLVILKDFENALF